MGIWLQSTYRQLFYHSEGEKGRKPAYIPNNILQCMITWYITHLSLDDLSHCCHIPMAVCLIGGCAIIILWVASHIIIIISITSIITIIIISSSSSSSSSSSIAVIIKSIIPIIFYAIYGDVNFQLTHFCFDDCENICTSYLLCNILRCINLWSTDPLKFIRDREDKFVTHLIIIRLEISTSPIVVGSNCYQPFPLLSYFPWLCNCITVQCVMCVHNWVRYGTKVLLWSLS